MVSLFDIMLDFINANQLLVSHEYKGVFKLNIDTDFNQIIDYSKLNIKEGPKSSILKYQNSILYSNEDGIYVYNQSQGEFTKDSLLSVINEGDNYLSG